MAQPKPATPDTAGSDQEPGTKVDNVQSIFKHEDPKFMQKLRDIREAVSKSKAKRDLINAEITEELAKFEAEGLSKKAAKAVMAYMELNPKDKQSYDITIAVMRKAFGDPIQGDLLLKAAIESEVREKEAAQE